MSGGAQAKLSQGRHADVSRPSRLPGGFVQDKPLYLPLALVPITGQNAHYLLQTPTAFWSDNQNADCWMGSPKVVLI